MHISNQEPRVLRPSVFNGSSGLTSRVDSTWVQPYRRWRRTGSDVLLARPPSLLIDERWVLVCGARTGPQRDGGFLWIQLDETGWLQRAGSDAPGRHRLHVPRSGDVHPLPGHRCHLEAALAEVGRVLEGGGGGRVRAQTLVASAEQARALGFVSRRQSASMVPTSRSSCGRVAARSAARPALGDGTIDCRVRGLAGSGAHRGADLDDRRRDPPRNLWWRGASGRGRASGGSAGEPGALLRGQGATGRHRELLSASRAGRVLRAVGEGLLLRRRGLWELRVPVGERRKVG